MTARHIEIRPGTYRDSVRLMQISQALTGVPGVGAAMVAMATTLNVELATGMGFAAPDGATPNDMLVAVAADDRAALDAALETLAGQLRATPVRSAGSTDAPPRTVGAAVRRADANLVLVSTPGEYAFADAMDALDAGASVLVFSDNVPVHQEVRLKDVAAARGLLVMGPDCGTAVVGGAGLGFANVVRPGPVGLVAASGTGAQQVMCLLDAAGVGVSHCLGVGGRDLSAAVGGRSTLAALDLLDADDDTELILVVSKPPAAEVAERVRAHAAGLRTPVRLALLGTGQPDLTAAVESVLADLGHPGPASWPCWPPGGPAGPTDGSAPRTGAVPTGAVPTGAVPTDAVPTDAVPTDAVPTDAVPTDAVPTGSGRSGALRGLFAGGTLCDEAMVIAAGSLGPVRSNIPLRPEWTVDGADVTAHTMLDLGDDAYTKARPHPMIDPGVRLAALAEAAADAACAVVLLDVVLGYVADPDPGATLGPAIAAAAGRGLTVVVSLTGTAGDPQGLDRQARALADAGAAVFSSNAEAARYAVGAVQAGTR